MEIEIKREKRKETDTEYSPKHKKDQPVTLLEGDIKKSQREREREKTGLMF